MQSNPSLNLQSILSISISQDTNIQSIVQAEDTRRITSEILSIAITLTEMNNVDLIPVNNEQAMGSLSKLDIHFADSVNESNSYNQTENLL